MRAVSAHRCAPPLLALLLVLLALPVHAAPPAPSPRPLTLPTTAATDLTGVEALPEHAAALAFLPGMAELGLTWTLRLDGSAPVSALGALSAFRLGPVALGIGLSGIGDGPGTSSTTTRLDLALALRLTSTFALGAHYHALWSRTSPLLDAYDAYDLSLTWRPVPVFSLAASLDRMNRPTDLTTHLTDPRLRLTLGFRPIPDRFSLTLAAARPLTTRATTWDTTLTARALLTPGLTVGAWTGLTIAEDASSPTAVSAGLTLGLTAASVSLDAGVDLSLRGPDDARLTTLARLSSAPAPSLTAPSHLVYHLKLAGPLSERPTASLFGPPRPAFAHLLAALDEVARDPRYDGLVLQIDQAPSWAQCWELRQAVARIRAAHKPVLAILTLADMRAHYLASSANEIALLSSGGLLLTGLSITQTYFLDLMNHLGIRAEFIKFAAFKSAPEPFTRSAPSDPAREQTQALLAGLNTEWMQAVTTARGLTTAALTDLLARGPQSMHVALEHHLVDSLLEPDELAPLITRVFGPAARLTDHLDRTPTAWARWGNPKKIAIIPVVGAISDGPSAGRSPLPLPFVGGETTGDATFSQAVTRALADSSIVAIVVRVSSGGGSAIASDRMNRTLRAARRKKPVFVSMGDIAASGGYYLAAGSPITMTPVTVTGSIGIFTGKVDLSGFYGKLGITTATEKTAPRADMASAYRPFTDDERQAAHDTLKAYYDRFLHIVAEGRGLPLADVEALAQGRVWLGKDALDRRLGDQVGGLWDTLVAARDQAGLSRDEQPSFIYLGSLNAFSSVERIIGATAAVLDGSDEASSSASDPSAASALSLPLLAELPALFGAAQLLATGAPLALMPYALTLP